MITTLDSRRPSESPFIISIIPQFWTHLRHSEPSQRIRSLDVLCTISPSASPARLFSDHGPDVTAQHDFASAGAKLALCSMRQLNFGLGWESLSKTTDIKPLESPTLANNFSGHICQKTTAHLVRSHFRGFCYLLTASLQIRVNGSTIYSSPWG